MLVIYEKCLFHVKVSSKLGTIFNREDVKFLKYLGDGLEIKDLRKEYEKEYPNDSIREFGKGQGIPSYIISNVRREESHKIILKSIDREEGIDGLL